MVFVFLLVGSDSFIRRKRSSFCWGLLRGVVVGSIDGCRDRRVFLVHWYELVVLDVLVCCILVSSLKCFSVTIYFVTVYFVFSFASLSLSFVLRSFLTIIYPSFQNKNVKSRIRSESSTLSFVFRKEILSLSF
jgi:hypothetical protein